MVVWFLEVEGLHDGSVRLVLLEKWRGETMQILEKILDDIDNFELDIFHILLLILSGLMFVFMLIMFSASYDSEIKRYGERAATYREIAEHLRDSREDKLWQEYEVVE